ncbi:hypothetical protein E2C01_019324 [Portunus trituberculatus]|uniref:Uncharacterized protein n=1 Tax=Portunus trituberculatus TaxID=210409 RepID=A0A5B7DWX3_PORTR|nr:hypothetical protein [Portunus trituberculatus]
MEVAERFDCLKMTSETGRNVAQPTFGQLLGVLPLEKRELVRQIEKNNQKINNAEVALAFNLVYR